MSATAELRKTFEEQLSKLTKQQPEMRWRWYHGVVFYVITQVVTFALANVVGLTQGRKNPFSDPDYYRAQRQIKIAPPPWVFGVAWPINNISVIYGNLRALNMPENTPGRATYLNLQAASWFAYMIFSASYFALRSPLNAVVVTIGMFALTIASLLVSIFQLKDSKIALSLVTLTLWLSLASVLASAQALWNKDDFYKVGPFVDPNPALLKQNKG